MPDPSEPPRRANAVPINLGIRRRPPAHRESDAYGIRRRPPSGQVHRESDAHRESDDAARGDYYSMLNELGTPSLFLTVTATESAAVWARNQNLSAVINDNTAASDYLDNYLKKIH